MGPYTTQILGDMGADIIKIRSPEAIRCAGSDRSAIAGMGAIFLRANRGKRSIVLDLKQPQGREALLKLAETADVLITNLRPQVMERLRLGYADVAAAPSVSSMPGSSVMARTAPTRPVRPVTI